LVVLKTNMRFMAKNKEIQLQNAASILRSVWMNREISRIEISRNVNLNKSTVTKMVSTLLEQGIVQEREEGEPGPQGGRKPILLELNKNYGYVAGMEFQPDSCRVVVTNLYGQIVDSWQESVLITRDNFMDTFKGNQSRIYELMENLGAPLLGIGIGISGLVNPETGRVIASIPFQMEDFPLVDLVTDDESVPVFIDNDSNAGAWGEIVFHKESCPQDFTFCLVEFHDTEIEGGLLGISVGLGIVLKGQLFHGPKSMAGEFRSVFWENNPNGQFTLTNEEMKRVQTDREVFDRFVRELAKNMAFLVNTLNLSRVVLGGDLFDWGGTVHQTFIEELKTNWSYSNAVSCEITFSSLGNLSVAYGAAGMVVDKIFFQNNNDKVLGSEKIQEYPFYSCFV